MDEYRGLDNASSLENRIPRFEKGSICTPEFKDLKTSEAAFCIFISTPNVSPENGTVNSRA
jgi:hypothetical protein